MKKRHIPVALFFLSFASAGHAQSPAPAIVRQGLVQGTVENDLTVYRGIPFAAPPLGELRWRAPQPAANWADIRKADRFAPRPIQGSGTGPEMSEDCLYAKSAGASSIAELRRFSPNRLPHGWGVGGAWPIIDGWVIPDDQYKLYSASAHHRD